MRNGKKHGIGAALIFAAATGCSSDQLPQMDFGLAPTDNGATGFYLRLDAAAWQGVTAHKGQGWTNELLTERVHDEINTLIEKGLRSKHIDCGRHWLMSQIEPLEDGGILFTGYCASDAELREAGRVHVHWDDET